VQSQGQPDHRLLMLQDWLLAVLDKPMTQLQPLADDASFRRYFRVHCSDNTYVVMDAPPEKENCAPFSAIAKTFHRLGLNVPVIYAEDLDQGFLLLTDFGDQRYIDVLNDKTADRLYQQACDDLLLIQSCQKITDYELPVFDSHHYYREMSLFRDWYLQRHLGVSLTETQLTILDDSYRLLIHDALSQPQVCVHLDYHSRNLMAVADNKHPGILDFQDAVRGPITYDLLSLLRDCYIDWPEDRVRQWVLRYQQQALQAGLLSDDNPEQFLRWFDWIGLQRNLKCMGMFARLCERDHKTAYLQYIPRVIRYAREICARYPQFSALQPLLMAKPGSES